MGVLVAAAADVQFGALWVVAALGVVGAAAQQGRDDAAQEHAAQQQEVEDLGDEEHEVPEHDHGPDHHGVEQHDVGECECPMASDDDGQFDELIPYARDVKAHRMWSLHVEKPSTFSRAWGESRGAYEVHCAICGALLANIWAIGLFNYVDYVN